MVGISVAPRNAGRLRKLKVGSVVLRTMDKKIDLADSWKHRDQTTTGNPAPIAAASSRLPGDGRVP